MPSHPLGVSSQFSQLALNVSTLHNRRVDVNARRRAVAKEWWVALESQELRVQKMADVSRLTVKKKTDGTLSWDPAGTSVLVSRVNEASYETTRISPRLLASTVKIFRRAVITCTLLHRT